MAKLNQDQLDEVRVLLLRALTILEGEKLPKIDDTLEMKLRRTFQE